MTAIKTENLSKRFGNVTALDSMNLVVPRNKVFGFLGPNGAGKTTTVKLLTGFLRPTKGTATVAGEAVHTGSMNMFSKIGLLPDVPAFYNWMTGEEYIHFIGETHKLSKNQIRERSDELLEMTELKKVKSRRIGGYSRGMRQRLGIAQALINKPEVLFLDEPTSALDPIGRREILEMIRQLKQSMTIFMSTHILADVERVCDMVGIIDKGRLLITSSVTELKKKYTRSVFEMEFVENPHPVLESLSNVEWLADPEILTGYENPVLRVRALDSERARHELPQFLTNSGLTITRYEMVTPDLEDIFIEIVKDEEPN